MTGWSRPGPEDISRYGPPPTPEDGQEGPWFIRLNKSSSFRRTLIRRGTIAAFALADSAAA